MTPEPTLYRPLDRTKDGTMTFGLLLPHFGAEASPSRIIGGAVMAEEAGFDAVWVRDHLLWEPHGMEGTDRTFVEPLTALAAIAARTSRVFLGTAVLIPLRWPLKLAQDLASLSYLAGGRVIAGLGLGSGEKELGAVGFQRRQRKQIFVETTDILRRVWSNDHVDYSGKLFSFSDVSISPKPVQPIPLWYGGTTDVSVRNSVDYCDGWIPGRIPVDTLEQRLRLLRDLSDEKDVTVTKAIIPLVKIDSDAGRARQGIDVDAMVSSVEGSKAWISPKSGGFSTIEDLRGLLVVGSADEVVNQIAELGGLGVDHFVFDLRLQYDRFERSLELIGSDVIPKLRTLRL